MTLPQVRLGLGYYFRYGSYPLGVEMPTSHVDGPMTVLRDASGLHLNSKLCLQWRIRRSSFRNCVLGYPDLSVQSR